MAQHFCQIYSCFLVSSLEHLTVLTLIKKWIIHPHYLLPHIPLIMRTLDTKMEEDDLQMKWTLALLPLPQPSPLLVLLRRRKHDGTIMPVLDRVIFCQNLSDQ